MGKKIFLAFAAITVAAMFIPVGSIAPQQAQASPAVPEPSSLILLGTGFLALLRYLRTK